MRVMRQRDGVQECEYSEKKFSSSNEFIVISNQLF